MGDIEVSIRVGEYGDGWLCTALDEEGDVLAEATGPTREQVAKAITEEARSYLAGEDGWDA